MRRALLFLLVIIPLLLAARTAPPQVEQPEDRPARNFTITGAGLSIAPGETLSTLHFSGGVSCVTADMELHADVLTLELQTSEITGGTKYEPPNTEVPTERLVGSPGETVRAMAAEMEIPRAQFDKSAIRQVVAQGNVRIKAEGFGLLTAELVSTDGGRSWYASGRSTVSHCDPDGNCYELSADYILYDLPTQKALARGAISGNYRTGDEAEPVEIRAERVELDLQNSLINASEGLEITYHGYILCCGSLTADIRGNLVRATGNPRLQQPDQGLTASAAAIELDLENMVLTATGGITVSEARQDLVLTAEQLTAYLEMEGRAEERLEATGNPHLQKGDSTFDGEQIVVIRNRDRDVTEIQVDGTQRAKLNLDELGTGKAEGAPRDGEPPSDSAQDDQRLNSGASQS